MLSLPSGLFRTCLACVFTTPSTRRSLGRTRRRARTDHSRTILSYIRFRDAKTDNPNHQVRNLHVTPFIYVTVIRLFFLNTSAPEMPKRSRLEEAEVERPSKRLRPQSLDRFSALSDELLLRTLSFLSITDLVLCERCEYKTPREKSLLTAKTISPPESSCW